MPQVSNPYSKICAISESNNFILVLISQLSLSDIDNIELRATRALNACVVLTAVLMLPVKVTFIPK